MNRIAIKIALAGLFAVALVGWASELDVLTCATRALAGAAAVYLVTRTALGWIVGILARAMARRLVPGRRRDGSE